MNPPLPEGEAYLLPEGEVYLLPEGEAHLLPEGEIHLLPEGEDQLLPAGEAKRAHHLHATHPAQRQHFFLPLPPQNS